MRIFVWSLVMVALVGCSTLWAMDVSRSKARAKVRRAVAELSR